MPIISAILGGCQTHTLPQSAAEVPGSFQAAVRTGDVVMRRGRSLASRAVLLSDGTYSHVGVAMRRGDSVWVVHAAPRSERDQGIVVREPLDTFLAADRATGAALFRSDALGDARRDTLAAVLEEYVSRRVHFDGDFDLRTADRVYCTELIWRAFGSVGIELLPRGVPARATPLGPRRIVFPGDLAAAPFVRRVASFERSVPVPRGRLDLSFLPHRTPQ